MLKYDFLDYEAMNNDFTYWPGSEKKFSGGPPPCLQTWQPREQVCRQVHSHCFHVQDGEDALKSLHKQLTGQVFNFSNDIQATVLELVWKALRSMRSPLQHDLHNQPSNEIIHQYLCAPQGQRTARLAVSI